MPYRTHALEQSEKRTLATIPPSNPRLARGRTVSAARAALEVPFFLFTYLSNEKMRFQSFFMLMTVQPSCVASSYNA